MSTKIKFCGITRAEDAQAAAALDVTALGFVFDVRSPRFLRAEAAARIAATLPQSVQTVALFRDTDETAVRAVLAAFTPSLLQFHGDESPEFCARFGLPYLKAVPMATPQDLAEWSRRYGAAQALLLDAHAPGAMGGSGRSFDWTQVPKTNPVPLVLAGGLTPENVTRAITMARPCAVDVSSGIESAPGIKDREKMQRFVQEVRRADASLV